MSRSLPHLRLTTTTSSLSPISSTSPIFPTVSPLHTSPMILDPYMPRDVPRQSGGSTQIPSLTLTPTTTVQSPNRGPEGSGACRLDFPSDSFTSYRSTPPPRCHEDGPNRILHHKLHYILGVSLIRFFSNAWLGPLE